MGVILRKRGQWFHLDIFDGGRWIRKPLHTSDRKKALRIRHELESAILAGEWNVALAMETTLARGIERFAAEYEPVHHAASTQVYTTLCFARYLEFMAGRRGHQITMDAVRKDDIEAFQLERSETVTVRGGPIAATTVMWPCFPSTRASSSRSRRRKLNPDGLLNFLHPDLRNERRSDYWKIHSRIESSLDPPGGPESEFLPTYRLQRGPVKVEGMLPLSLV